MREFNTDTLRIITAFENITQSEVRDCIVNDVIYFLVNAGRMGKAIGKNGMTIKTAEKLIGKKIKVFEYSENETELIKNLMLLAQKIEIRKNKVTVTINAKDRGMIIGKNGSNIKVIKEFLIRNSNIKDIEIK